MQSVCGAADRGRTGTIGEDRGILSPLRLPIPPQRQEFIVVFHYIITAKTCQAINGFFAKNKIFGVYSPYIAPISIGSHLPFPVVCGVIFSNCRRLRSLKTLRVPRRL